jgi:HPt (histidine-containing phosphotransfer) domain-containing protein
MTSDEQRLEAEFAQLKSAFRARLVQDGAAFAAALPHPQQAALRELAQRAHRLAGAAGSFDEPALSQAARRFELSAAGGDAKAVAAALHALLRALQRTLP